VCRSEPPASSWKPTAATAAGQDTCIRRQHGARPPPDAEFRGLPGSASYSASKAAIAVYADALRCELHGTPITVTTLYPGFIDTPLDQDLKRRPFLISLDKGAAVIADKIEQGVKTSTIPVYPWNVLSRVLPILPTGQIAKMGMKRPL
jgi:NAD(P)-dependent dehydrogenase (short-subunit alcohol dehydrogenase family)